MRILIVEDEKRLALTLADILENADYRTDIADNGEDGLEMAKSTIYDAVILDIMLPKMDGYQVLQQLRSAGFAIPVLMLTAKSSLNDRVAGLDLGADYYLTKPFEPQELLACLRAVLRRQSSIIPDSLTFGDLTLVPSSSMLFCKDKHTILNAKELEILNILFQNTNQFVTKETLLLKIWGYDAKVSLNSVEAYISFIRKKLYLLDSSVYIYVARNIGYKLEVKQ